MARKIIDRIPLSPALFNLTYLHFRLHSRQSLLLVMFCFLTMAFKSGENTSAGYAKDLPLRISSPEEIKAVTTEHFTGDADGTTSFAGPGGENFQLTGDISVDSNPGDGTTGDDQWAGTPRNTYLSNAVGTITLCESTKAFQIVEIDCWTSINGGANYAVGDVTFIGYLHGGGTVSYTTTVTPTDDHTGYDPVSFSGTALDGVNLRSLQFVLPGSITYLGVDAIDYSIVTGLSSYNSVPTVSGVSVSGLVSKGSILTGSYTFHDCDDAESGTTHQWYRSDDASGTNKTAISGATSQTYSSVYSDVDKYLTYEATPSDGTGTGIASTSSYFGPVTCGVNYYDEDFEDNSGTSFTNNGQSFTVSGSNAAIVTFSNYGWNGTANDDRYIDNDADADANDGAEITIATSDGTDILIQSFYVYCAEDDYTRSASANLTITGKKNSVTQFTVSKTSGFNTTSTYNGYNFIDLEVEGGSDNSTTLIDELVLSTTGVYDYLAIDALNWATVSYDPATLTTTSITTFDATSATMGGEVTDNGCASVTERGVVYNTTGTPTTADSKVSIGTGLGTFSQSISGLSGNTTYYIRSYAINTEGTAYGSEETFTTSPFPVELISFTGNYIDEQVNLTWKTASEHQNKGFYIMRLSESEWNEIGFVEGANTHEGLLTYDFADPFPSLEKSLYYQLVQEDINGSLNYSHILEISPANISDQVDISPNPVVNSVNIRSLAQNIREVRLLDLQGKVILARFVHEKEAQMELTSLSPGVYIAVVVLANNQQIVKKLFLEK